MWNRCLTWNHLWVGSGSVRGRYCHRKLNLCIVVAEVAAVEVAAAAAVADFHVGTSQIGDACWSQKCFGGVFGSMICEMKCACCHGRRRRLKCQLEAGLGEICWLAMDSWMRMEVFGHSKMI